MITRCLGRRSGLFLLVALCVAQVWAQAAARPFVLPVFSDHMVLQREMTVPVWGWTTPGATVSVRLDDKELATAVAGADGKWMAKLAPLQAGGPHTLTIAGPQTVTLQDVLIGDVWIASGQSNSELDVNQVANAEAEKAAGDHPQIRYLRVGKKPQLAPVEVMTGSWLECTPRTVGNFPAAGYFFARKLQQELHIPIGILTTGWNGSAAEAWVSAQGLKHFPEFAPKLQEIADAAADPEAYTVKFMQALADWWPAHDPGMRDDYAWSKPGLDTTGWKTLALPTSFEEAFGNFDGLVWFRKTVEIPESWVGKTLTMRLCPILNSDITWINGVKVSNDTRSNVPRVYTVPASAVKAGKNEIVIRLINTNSKGGIIGDPAMMTLSIADDPAAPAIPLAGDWRYQVTIEFHETPIPARLDAIVQNPTILSNGMLEPIIPFAIKGAIWYQGETNAWNNPGQYYTLLPALIADWRTRWGQGNFPFYIVQLANYQKVSEQPAESNWATLRDAQLQTALTVPNCGMSVTIDIGDEKDIHPKNKQDVGLRLALIALAQTYGQHIEYSGPLYQSMKREGNKLRLSFTHAGGGLVTRGDKLTGFALCGPDGVYVWADAVIEGDTVVVSAPQVTNPVAVRYAWANNPVCNLYNQAGLPASPFQAK